MRPLDGLCVVVGGGWCRYLWGGMESQTFFFSDDFLAGLKAQVAGGDGL